MRPRALLQEMIYHKDAEKLMLRVNQARVQAEARPYVLEASAQGETLDPERHHPRIEATAKAPVSWSVPMLTNPVLRPMS